MSKEIEAWKGEFGDDYTERNIPDDAAIENRSKFWAGVFGTLPIQSHNKPHTILEIGANVGANLIALEKLYKAHKEPMNFYAIEPNELAKKALKLADIRSLKILDGIAEDIPAPNASIDIVFTCGVLIHIPPNKLPKAMSEIHRVSRRFIICAEYFSPSARPIKYRGEDELLWANDFGELYLQSFPGLRCLGYSFAWKRFTGMDNLTWWVFEKVN